MLGEGAMGQVFLAFDPELEREVAVKVLRLDRAGAARDAYIARFRNEARAAARFCHPHVVAAHDAGVDPVAGPYVVYEFVDGYSLRHAMDRDALTHADVLRIARGVASALDALEQASIVHRDIKPDNILLGHDGSVKVTDFGIARVPDSALTRDGQFLGTPAYAPPESISLGVYSHRGDVFSLGAVLFEALAGDRPFPGDDAVKVSYAVVHDEPQRATKVRPSLPAAVDAVFARALAKKPAQRYESSAAMVRALEEALRPVTPAHAAATVTRRPSAARRQKFSAEQTFGSILLALLFVVGLVMWIRRRDESETPDPVGAAVIAAPRVVAPPRARPRRVATVRDAGVRR